MNESSRSRGDKKLASADDIKRLEDEVNAKIEATSQATHDRVIADEAQLQDDPLEATQAMPRITDEQIKAKPKKQSILGNLFK